jgi:hypothetical protein
MPEWSGGPPESVSWETYGQAADRARELEALLSAAKQWRQATESRLRLLDSRGEAGKAMLPADAALCEAIDRSNRNDSEPSGDAARRTCQSTKQTLDSLLQALEDEAGRLEDESRRNHKLWEEAEDHVTVKVAAAEGRQQKIMADRLHKLLSEARGEEA